MDIFLLQERQETRQTTDRPRAMAQHLGSHPPGADSSARRREKPDVRRLRPLCPVHNQQARFRSGNPRQRFRQQVHLIGRDLQRHKFEAVLRRGQPAHLKDLTQALRKPTQSLRSAPTPPQPTHLPPPVALHTH